MNQYKATQAGRHLSMFVNNITRSIRILETKYLEVGETIDRPDGAYILLIVDTPEELLAQERS